MAARRFTRENWEARHAAHGYNSSVYRRALNAIAEQKLVALGDVGAAFRAQLDPLVDELEQRWGVTVQDELDGGTHAFVARAVGGEGEALVLKIALPQMRSNGSFVAELRAMVAGQHAGYARVVAFDEQHRALLMEQLGGALADEGRSANEQIEIICDTLHPWAAPPADLSLQTTGEKAAWLRTVIETQWDEQGGPCSRAVMTQAFSYMERRAAAFDARTAVLVHGDAHPGNLLRASDATYKLIDPDPMIGEPAADLAVLMRDWNTELVASGDPCGASVARCVALHERTGVAMDAIWEWGFMERVSTALYTAELGLTDWSQPAFVVAEACVRANPG